MLTIRFSRIGKKKKPFYRIIISDKRKDTQNKYRELLGHYNPHTKAATIKVDRVQHWLSTGATLSNSVFNLMVKEGVISSDKKRKAVSISKKRSLKIEEKKKVDAKDQEKQGSVEEKEAQAPQEANA